MPQCGIIQRERMGATTRTKIGSFPSNPSSHSRFFGNVMATRVVAHACLNGNVAATLLLSTLLEPSRTSTTSAQAQQTGLVEPFSLYRIPCVGRVQNENRE